MHFLNQEPRFPRSSTPRATSLVSSRTRHRSSTYKSASWQ